jgi:hypothetical protein
VLGGTTGPLPRVSPKHQLDRGWWQGGPGWTEFDFVGVQRPKDCEYPSRRNAQRSSRLQSGDLGLMHATRALDITLRPAAVQPQSKDGLPEPLLKRETRSRRDRNRFGGRRSVRPDLGRFRDDLRGNWIPDFAHIGVEIGKC